MMNCASSVTENGSSEHMLAKINPQNKIFIIIQYINHKTQLTSVQFYQIHLKSIT